MTRTTVPVQEALRARVIDLHEKGVGRNDIARLTEISTASVSRIVKAAGGKFDTRQTESATAHRVADLAALRSSLAARLISKAHDLVDDMDAPFTAFSFGGTNNTFASETLDRAPADAIRNLMVSMGQAVKSSLDLTRFDVDPNEGLSAVDQWLGAVSE